MYIPLNNNPLNRRTDDCVVRALSKALNKPWEEVYIDLCLKGLEMCDWGNNNAVWDEYLRDKDELMEQLRDLEMSTQDEKTKHMIQQFMMQAEEND